MYGGTMTTTATPDSAQRFYGQRIVCKHCHLSIYNRSSTGVWYHGASLAEECGLH